MQSLNSDEKNLDERTPFNPDLELYQMIKMLPSLCYEWFSTVNHSLVVHTTHPKTDCIFF